MGCTQGKATAVRIKSAEERKFEEETEAYAQKIQKKKEALMKM